MYRNGYNAYQHSAVNTVEDKNTILLKLFEGAIRFTNQAKKGILENRTNLRGESISKIMAVITELDCALDMDKGGQLSQHLASLYRYMMGKLTIANSKNDIEALEEVTNILTTLQEGFESAAKAQQPQRTPAPPVYEETGAQERLRHAV